MVLMSGVTAARSLGVDFGLTSQPMVELGQGIEV
jgi:hypothetical protein